MTTTTPTQIALVTSPVRNHDAGAPIGGPAATSEVAISRLNSRPGQRHHDHGPYVRVRGGPSGVNLV